MPRRFRISVGLLAAVVLAACGRIEAEPGGVISELPQAPPPIINSSSGSPSPADASPNAPSTSGDDTSAKPSDDKHEGKDTGKNDGKDTGGDSGKDTDGQTGKSTDDDDDKDDAKENGDDRATEQPVIVIDPGHSGESIKSRERRTGLTDFDYPNDPEMDEVFAVSSCVTDALEDLDYKVIMTKEHVDDTVGLVERAEIANEADADLAVSVHNDHSQDDDFQAVYSQRGVKDDGDYGEMWRGAGDNRTVFDRPKVARASARFAEIIAEQRSDAQHTDVVVAEFNFIGREGLEPGNIPMVMLFAEVPWVYNEAGARTGGSDTKRVPMSDLADYAKGLLDGIVEAVPSPVDESPASSRELRKCIVEESQR